MKEGRHLPHSLHIEEKKEEKDEPLVDSFRKETERRWKSIYGSRRKGKRGRPFSSRQGEEKNVGRGGKSQHPSGNC